LRESGLSIRYDSGSGDFTDSMAGYWKPKAMIPGRKRSLMIDCTESIMLGAEVNRLRREGTWNSAQISAVDCGEILGSK
jgi:hypothetical protein